MSQAAPVAPVATSLFQLSIWAWIAGQELFRFCLPCWEFIRGMCWCLSSEILHFWLSMAQVCTWTSCTENEKLSDMKTNWSLRSIAGNAQWQISLWSWLFFPVFYDEERNGWHVSKAALSLVTQGENIFVFTWSFDLQGSCGAWDLCGLGFEIWVPFWSWEGVLKKRVVMQSISVFQVFPGHPMHNQIWAVGWKLRHKVSIETEIRDT